MAADDDTPPPATPAADPASPPTDRAHPVDAVRARRAVVAKWNTLATRVGYLMFLVAIVMFFVAFTTDFTEGKATVIVAAMVVGCVLLAPAIVIGYAVKAAEKDDIARGL